MSTADMDQHDKLGLKPPSGYALDEANTIQPLPGAKKYPRPTPTPTKGYAPYAGKPIKAPFLEFKDYVIFILLAALFFMYAAYLGAKSENWRAVQLYQDIEKGFGPGIPYVESGEHVTCLTAGASRMCNYKP